MGLFDDKVAVVTGAGRGIGRAYALALAREGAKVLVNDIGLELRGVGAGLDWSQAPDIGVAAQVVEDIRQAGGEAAADCTDVGDIARAGSIVRKAIDTFGDIDIVINNAGAWHESTSFDIDNTRFDAEFATHVKGSMGTTTAAMKHMRDKGHGGRIVNTITLFNGAHGMAVYSAAKAAVASFTLTAATEGTPYGITVNAMSPTAVTRQSRAYFVRVGAVREDDEELMAYASPEVNVPLAMFLASDLSRNITGQFFRTGPAEFVVGAPIRIGITNLERGLELHSHDWTPQTIAQAMPQFFGGQTSEMKLV